MTTIKDITNYLETIAPLSLQEAYDNCGLIIGDAQKEVTGILICLDSTEEVVLEAKKNGCNLIVAHHPIIFSGLKKLNGSTYIERTVISAIKNDIAIYAAHTNMDNILMGVNKVIADKLGLINTKILSPKSDMLRKLVVFCPPSESDQLRQALFNAGGGEIGNYDNCSFITEGTGTFRPLEGAKPKKGEIGKVETSKEEKIEIIFEKFKKSRILKAMFDDHPYEEIAYDIYPIENSYQNIGSGMIGELQQEMDEMTFLKHLKMVMGVGALKYTDLLGGKVKKIAVCGGSGSFLLNKAISSDAQIFITSDFKYHQFFDAEKKVVIADIGHFESEQYTMELFKSLILKNFSKFAVRLTEVKTNPVNYL